LPLCGWLVTAYGELRPLPLSLDDRWTIRPQTAQDEAPIAATAARLRPTRNIRKNWSYFDR